MAGEQTLTIKLKVDDQGTVVLDQFTKKVETMGKSVQNSLSLIKLDSLINLGERAYRAGQQVYNFGKEMTALGSDLQRNARSLGMTTTAYQEWMYVAKAADVEVEQFALSIRYLTNVMADSPKELEKLGLSAREAGGRLKSMEDILPEIIKRISSLGTVAEQNAAAMNVFGARSGMAMANLIREGHNIDDLKKRFKELGLEIGEETVKRLAESEQAFKDFGFAIMKIKASAVPMIEAMAKAISWLAEVMGNLGTTVQDFHQDMTEAIDAGDFEAVKSLTAKKYGTAEGLSEARFIGVVPKAPAAGIAGARGLAGGLTESQRKIIGEEKKQLEEDFWTTQKFLWENTESMEDYYKRIAELDKEMILGHVENLLSLRVEDDKFFQENVQTMEDYLKERAEMDKEMILGASENSRLINEMLRKDTKTTFDSIGKSMGDVLTQNMVMLMSTTDKWAEKFKKAGESILQTIAQIILKTTIMNLLFGNAQGKYTSGSGLVGIIGSAIGFQEGGIVTRPTLAMIGEGGHDEAVIPLTNGKIPLEGGGGGNVYIFNNISAIDVQSMDEALQKNAGSILSINKRSARIGGAFRNSVRGY